MPTRQISYSLHVSPMINVINVHLSVIRNASNGGEDETLFELSASEYDNHKFSEFKVSVKDVSDHIMPQISIYCSTWHFFFPFTSRFLV